MMHSATKSAALIIVGHGSTLNPDSSAPTLRCADEIRQRGIFAEVVCAFWKEEPSMREVFYSVSSDLIFIVPNFISEGYFTREVLPRELKLDGPVTHREGKTIVYCDPVGIHPHMTRLLLHRADEVAPGVPRAKTSLIIVGHGTSLNEQSRKAIEAQVALIRSENHGFAEVCDAYMEEAPLIAKWDEITSAHNVVVVPFFIADGLHSYQDIPVMLGIEPEPTAAASRNEVFRHNPHPLRSRRLYYSSAIGTEPMMANVILDQVTDAVSRHGVLPGLDKPSPVAQPTLPAQAFTMGQVRATPQADGTWTLHHIDDRADDPSLKKHTQAIAGRDIALCDDAGEFRALKTAPTLRRGWLLQLPDARAQEQALDFIYPGTPGLWQHHAGGTLRPVPLRETLSRQTGMYRFANNITDEQAQQMVACHCDSATKCLRQITWPLTSSQPMALPETKQLKTTTPDSVPLICVEACTHIVSAARELARENHAQSSPGKA